MLVIDEINGKLPPIVVKGRWKGEAVLMYLYNVVYDLGNIANWLNAIGTISAVIVALYFSKREVRPRAIATVRFSYGVSPLGVTEDPIMISAEIVNLGLIPIQLKECTIALGKEKMVFLDGSHSVDNVIKPGESYEHHLNYEDPFVPISYS